MDQTRARQLAAFLRTQIPSCIAIATQESRYYGRFPNPGEPWVVVANGTMIHDPQELSAK